MTSATALRNLTRSVVFSNITELDHFVSGLNGDQHCIIATLYPEVCVALRDRTEAIGKRRKVGERHVGRLARDIVNNNWVWTGEAISLTTQNHPNNQSWLLNGNHRTEASIKSKRPILVTLAANVDFDALPIMDSGKPRTFANHAQFFPGLEDITMPEVRIGSLFVKNGNSKTQSKTQHDIFTTIVKYRAVIKQAHSYKKPDSILNSPVVLAAIARGLLVDGQADGIEELVNGIKGEDFKQSGQNGLITRFKDRAQTVRGVKYSASGNRERYLLTEATIQKWCSGNYHGNIMVPKSELFPIPED